MATFESVADKFDELADMLTKMGNAVDSTPPAPDAPEQIAAKMGIKLDRVMQGPTPLSDTPEQAILESEQKVQTRMEQLTSVFNSKIKAVIG